MASDGKERLLKEAKGRGAMGVYIGWRGFGEGGGGDAVLPRFCLGSWRGGGWKSREEVWKKIGEGTHWISGRFAFSFLFLLHNFSHMFLLFFASTLHVVVTVY